MPNSNLTFGQWIRQQRKALDLTQEALGLLVSCSPHTVRKIEADERHPSRRLTARLAEHLRIAPDEQAFFRAAARGVGGQWLARERDGLGAAFSASAFPAAGDAWPQGVGNAFAAGDATARETPGRPATPTPRPFIGRERECRDLRAHLARLPTHHGRTVLLEGEAGIGKSRLMQEVCAHALRAGLPVASSKCHEIERDVAYRALVDLIEQALALAPAGFERRLDDVARAEIALLVPALAARWEGLPTLSAELPQARQVRLFAAVQSLFQALAEPNGLLLVLDDLQWLDDASALALLHLAQHAASTRVLLLLACRSEDLMAEARLTRIVAELQAGGLLERMALSGLTRAEVADLLRPAWSAPFAGPPWPLGGSPGNERHDEQPLENRLPHGLASPAVAPPAEWLSTWHDWCRGNPLFLVAAMDEGLLAGGTLPTDGMAAQGGPQTVPAQVQAVVRGRLARLSGPARRLIDAAAAIGRGADFELMQAVAADHVAAVSARGVDAGQDEDAVDAVGPDHTGAARDSGAAGPARSVDDAGPAGLGPLRGGARSPASHPAAHARHSPSNGYEAPLPAGTDGWRVDTLRVDWLDALEELLSRQWLTEDDASDGYTFQHDQLRDAVLAEMSPARRTLLHASVARHLERRDAAPHALIAEHEEHARRWGPAARQRLLAGTQAEAMFAVQDAIAHYSRGLALAEQHAAAVPQALVSELLERRGLAHAWLNQADLAAADLQPAVTRALARLHAGRAVELLIALGMSYQRADRFAPGAEVLHQALRLARELNDHKSAATAMWWLGDIEWSLDHNAAASGWFDQVMALTEAAGLDDEVRIKAHHGLGEVAVLDARPAEGLVQFWRSLAIAQRVGDTRMVCENLIVIAWAHLGAHGTGRYEAAIEHCDQVSVMVEEADMHWYHAPALTGKAAALAALGRFGDALACFGPALAVSRELGMARFEAMVLTWLAECCLDAEQAALALAHAEHARGLMDEHGVSFFSHLLRAVHAQALIRLGRLDEVPDLNAALAVARERRLGHAVLRTLDTLTEWHHARGDATAARASAHEWAALADAHGVPESRCRALAWSARLHADGGQHVAALKRVERLLAEMSATARFSLRLALHREARRCAQALNLGTVEATHAAAVARLEATLADAAPWLTAFVATTCPA